MRSPFQSEPEAFRSVLLVIFALLAIVLAAAFGPTWLALVVLAGMVGALALRIAQRRVGKRRRVEMGLRSAPAHVGPVAERRVLIVANDTLREEALLSEVERLASAPHTRVLLLTPAVISPGARLTGAIDRPLDQARVRLDAALDRVGRDLDVTGEVSEADPLEAVEDAFATFAADEVIVTTRGEWAWGGLEPRLAGLVRERFAVPVRHLVFEPGSGAQEPDRDTEARYRHEFEEAVTRKGRVVLAGVGILASLLMSTVALVQSRERRQAGATSVVTQTAAVVPKVVKVVDLKIIGGSKVGPDGKKHDAFTTTEFAVKVGQPLTLKIDNTDDVPHSITAPVAGVNIIAQPGTHTYTLIVKQAGKFQWYCVLPCDTDANGWAMQHPGFMNGYITAI